MFEYWHGFIRSNRNKNGSYKWTAWIQRSSNRNDPWWYCPECNIACQFQRIDDRDKDFAAHIKSKHCVNNKRKKDKTP